MDMPQPTPGHALLERMAGHWSGEETMHPSRWDPAGGKATGVTQSRMGLGGFALISNYHQERDGQVAFRGHGVYTYDPDRELYRLHWFDSMGNEPEVFTGHMEDEILTLSHEGPPMHARMTYDLSTPGQMLGTMDMSEDGQEWQRLFEGVYRRSS